MTDHVKEAEDLLRRAGGQEADWGTALALRAIGHLLLDEALSRRPKTLPDGRLDVTPPEFDRIT